jgi:hypothetical protein
MVPELSSNTPHCGDPAYAGDTPKAQSTAVAASAIEILLSDMVFSLLSFSRSTRVK